LFLILRCEILFINSKNIKIMQDKELERYSRHILLPEIEFEGQKKLLQSHCLVIGAGGLGSPVAIYLAASGVGKITICDFDSVDLSNLQRQIIHEENSIGLNKAESAKIALNRINSDINVVAIKKQLNIDEVKSMAEGVDVIVDCSDNFETRYALNEIAFDLKRPLISGAAIKFDGQVSVFDFRTNNSPCYKCLFPRNDEEQTLNCSDHGVFSPLVGLVGSIQAGEVIKVLLNIGTTLHGKLLLINHRDIDFKSLKIQKDKYCEICA
jgi:molybdopterin/thiamine biosynthesis adenylyltransferase